MLRLQRATGSTHSSLAWGEMIFDRKVQTTRYTATVPLLLCASRCHREPEELLLTPSDKQVLLPSVYTLSTFTRATQALHPSDPDLAKWLREALLYLYDETPEAARWAVKAAEAVPWIMLSEKVGYMDVWMFTINFPS